MTGPLPVTVVGGYLGAGKTTLVNHLLRNAQGLRIAILVNDFGALAIDADLIEARSEDLISIAGGCICCSFGSDLMGALMKLAQRDPAPDHVLIETSGVAMPDVVARSAALIPAYAIDSVVVLADAETVRARAADRYMGDTITRQLDAADLVVLNRTDLVAAAELEALRRWMAREAPRARLIEAVRAEVPAEAMFGYSHPAVGSGTLASGAIRPAEDAAARYESASFLPDRPMDVEALARALARPECGLVRAKGVLCDADGLLKTLHLAGARFEVRPFPHAGAAATGIACIGLRGRFNRAAIEDALARAAAAAR
ncbi:MAG: GTP-binding protein [Proteobacteria bacterium]|nr:GTP-binding protein [Pseudomonadota bacterium]